MPAGLEKQVNFAWIPKWLFILLFVPVPFIPHPTVFIVLMIVMQRTRVVSMPVCQEHNGFWNGPKVLFVLGFIGTIGGTVTSMMVSSENPGIATILFVGAFCWFFVSMLLAFIWRLHYIRATRIADSEISLNNVHPHFVTALEKDRKRYRDEQQGWITRYD